MRFDISKPLTNEILRRDGLQHGYPCAGIDVSSHNTTHFGQIICVGKTQEEADRLAARVFAALDYAQDANCLARAADTRDATVPLALPVRLMDGPSLGHWWAVIDSSGQTVGGAATQVIGQWLVTLINGGNDAALDCLRNFTRAISATGGICADEGGRPLSLVGASEEWVDLADAYMKACDLLGEAPVVEPGMASKGWE